MIRLARFFVVAAALMLAHPARAEAPVRLGWLGVPPAADRPFAFVDGPPAADQGLAGLRLAVADNNASGKFLKQSYALEVAAPQADAAAALGELAAKGVRFVVVDLPAPVLAKAAADPRAANLVLFNAGAPDDELRAAQCRRNVLHTIPSRAMLADGLGQLLVRKNWKNWLLLVGPEPEDKAFAAALQRSARKFGAKVVAERAWTFTRDSRHGAEGEVAELTRDSGHDVVLVADEAGNFAEAVPYNTFHPRPVAGSAGLVPAGWHAAHESLGAAQLFSRFKTATGRVMGPKDFAAWAAGRAVAEAALRARSADAETIAAMLRSDAFTLAAFMGRGLSFRSWDGQLRQPILLAQPRQVVATAPMEGFLHPVTDLDTLGTDKGEKLCVFR